MFFRRKNAAPAHAHGSASSVSPTARPVPVATDADFDARLLAIGKTMLETARRSGEARSMKEKLTDWAMADTGFKVQLFRFVDVFPQLADADQVHQHLVEYLSQPGVKMPPGLDLGLKAGGMMKGMLSKTVASQITSMGQRFIAGRDADQAMPALSDKWKNNIAFSVDLLGEAVVSEEEAAIYQQRYLTLIERLAEQVQHWPNNDLLERDHLGPIPRANVSVKISSLAARVDPIAHDATIAQLFDVLKPILESAARKRVFVNFDIEQHELKEMTYDLFMHCCEKIDFPAGLAMQAYLRSGDDDAARMIRWAKQTGRQVTVRLVKGAYWDYELIHAEEKGWPVPVWTDKRDTDACFERMAEQFIQATPRDADQGGIKLALGSHNARSIAFALATLEQHDLPRAALELQMLTGMAAGLKHAAIEQSLRLREYVPVGEMIPGMAYLVRRLLENTSNESWLLHSTQGDASDEQLLASPHRAQPAAPPPARQPQRHQLSCAVQGLADGQPFLNEPARDFADQQQRDAFIAALNKPEAQVPQIANDATAKQADEAVSTAQAAFANWRDMDPLHRAGLIIKTAALMREQRDILAGIVIREGGKPWREADGDVCEAIDFCEYYARESVGLFVPRRLGRFMGELNETWHQPRGVAVVINPWNFPLAICTGMTAAALTTGNTVIVKPAEQTAGIAKAMCQRFWQAGVPRDVLQLLPGVGEVVGAALVRDPRVSLIAFTGSKAVGLDIVQAAGITPDEQMHVKKVICEMGGKNAIIVDASADLDEAVVGVRYSAFGYSGQKCSACSRVIVHQSIHDLFVKRLVEATRALIIGDPLDPATDVGPVIDQDAAHKIRRYIEIGQQEGTLALAHDVPADAKAWGDKPFIGPHIFTDIHPEHRLAQEEIFGPVLSVIRVNDIDEALTVANGTPYKLTGGLFSRTPSHIQKIRRAFRVGNLYINRGNTGALVGRQPFGGFGLSGVGSKAGGDEYLHQFVEPRACTENTMRRGFSPELI